VVQKLNKTKKDILATLEHFPFLKYLEESKFFSVQGEIALVDDDIGEFDRYSVVIQFPKEYPNCFPKVKETSKKIPRGSNRHVNPDGSLCLAVPPEEHLITKNGINFKFFIDKVLIPHLSRETYREKSGYYPDGEYEHGIDGIWQFYFQRLGINDKKQVISELSEIRNSKWPNRNAICSCGSQKKFKQCHLGKWLDIKRLGDFYLENQIETLKKEIQND
jgi:hypothetical protein